MIIRIHSPERHSGELHLPGTEALLAALELGLVTPFDEVRSDAGGGWTAVGRHPAVRAALARGRVAPPNGELSPRRPAALLTGLALAAGLIVLCAAAL